MRTFFILIFISRTVMSAEFHDRKMLESVLSELDSFKSMMETCNLKLEITESLETRLASLEEENRKLNKRVQELEASSQTIKQQEFRYSSLKDQAEESVPYRPKRFVRSRNLSHQTQQKLRQTEQSVTRVAFTASVSVPDLPNLGDHQTIIFDSNIISNIGQAYHPHSGIFLAPVKGVYVFTVTLAIRLHHYMYFEIVSDGSTVAEIYADSGSGSHVSTTRQWIFVVNKSTEVWIRTKNGGEANGSTHTSFSGFLLYEME